MDEWQKVKKHSFIYRLFSGFSPEADGFHELPSTEAYIVDDVDFYLKTNFICRNI